MLIINTGLWLDLDATLAAVIDWDPFWVIVFIFFISIMILLILHCMKNSILFFRILVRILSGSESDYGTASSDGVVAMNIFLMLQKYR